MQAAHDRQKSYVDLMRKPMEFQVGDMVMLKVSPWKGVVCFGKRGKLNPRYVGPFKVLEKKCYSDEPLAVPFEGLHIDDKLRFVEEPIEIIDQEVKRLKQSRIPIVKVRWNSKRGPEFIWEREDQFQKKGLQLTGLPCDHGFAAIYLLHRDHKEYVVEWRRNERFVFAYNHYIEGMNEMNYWPYTSYQKPLPLIKRRMHGRPPHKRREMLLKMMTQSNGLFIKRRRVCKWFQYSIMFGRTRSASGVNTYTMCARGRTRSPSGVNTPTMPASGINTSTMSVSGISTPTLSARGGTREWILDEKTKNKPKEDKTGHEIEDFNQGLTRGRFNQPQLLDVTSSHTLLSFTQKEHDYSSRSATLAIRVRVSSNQKPGLILND
ncbi:hypothetical protein Tco_0941543 [Tanacetum coccineum]|uniref:Tf2-1-like SH3-like domain-containing protein n=1 Tax=Tanacetum coccineum TaxID=301880 RepID=A0ABQ5DS18_9ASTR